LGVVDVSEAHDRELVDRLRQGDEDAFRGLFGRYAPSAKALALRVVRQSHLAEEIVQEAFLAVWRAPESYDDERGSVRSWLMGMVHHRAVDLVRREESQRRRSEQRDVLTMMYFDGLSQSQIAERTGIPLGTVKSRTLLGMRRLRTALEGIER